MHIDNINIGLMGHVDSGKTSICKLLSTHNSTASFDKSPQSQKRGITLDLGFSSCFYKINNHSVLFTFVDCPGHASLIKTVIGASSIIQLIILVIDITKGIQAQTAECIILAEIVTSHLIIVLNKIDLLGKNNKNSKIQKYINRIKKVFKKTKFGVNIPIIALSTKEKSTEPVNTLLKEMYTIYTTHSLNSHIPNCREERFIFIADHCFSIKGKGEVVTGTIINGNVKLEQTVEFPSLLVKRKIKSIEMFSKSIPNARKGDRIGLLFHQLNSKNIERTILCEPGVTVKAHTIIISVEKIRLYKEEIESGKLVYISINHDSVVAKISFFKYNNTCKNNLSNKKTKIDFDFAKKYLFLQKLPKKEKIYSLLELKKGIICYKDCTIIGSQINMTKRDDKSQNRIMLFGKCLYYSKSKGVLNKLCLYKEKSKEGRVERVISNSTIIGTKMFENGGNVIPFIGMKISIGEYRQGVIECSFGNKGKFKIRIEKENDKEKYCEELELLKSKLYLKYKRMINGGVNNICQ